MEYVDNGCEQCTRDEYNAMLFCGLECRNKYAAENPRFPSFVYMCSRCGLLTPTPYGYCDSKECVAYYKNKYSDVEQKECLIL